MSGSSSQQQIPHWLTVLGVLASLVVSVFALVYSARSVRHAAESAEAAKLSAEDTRAPMLSVTASYVRTPVPNYMDFVIARCAGADSLQLSGDEKLFKSSGIWHVKVENKGDAVADSVRVRAPGIFYARQVAFAQGMGLTWTKLANEEHKIGDLAPGQLASVVLWVLPGYMLSEVCQPTAGVNCFTKNELVVYAENANSAPYVESFDPDDVRAPEDTPAQGSFGSLKYFLIGFAVVVVAALAIWVARRSKRAQPISRSP